MFKNCMLRPEVLGAMGVHSLTRLHDQLAHYQLRPLPMPRSLSVKSLPFGNLLRQVREERDSAIAERNREVEKYNGLVTSHTASEGKLKAKISALSSSLEASKADLEGVKTSLQESDLKKEALA
ncbi:hypothetical protein LIER_43895 [Lithospermum erythrorhizon]|uniref:Uncharacterized protein n=1 Tax=Lithospermum erythrorhizon TaxID=34254 RepID=A0AAV3R9U6_LITER